MLTTKLKHLKHIQNEPGIFEVARGAGNQIYFLFSRVIKNALIALYIQVAFFYLSI